MRGASCRGGGVVLALLLLACLTAHCTPAAAALLPSAELEEAFLPYGSSGKAGDEFLGGARHLLAGRRRSPKIGGHVKKVAGTVLEKKFGKSGARSMHQGRAGPGHKYYRGGGKIPGFG